MTNPLDSIDVFSQEVIAYIPSLQTAATQLRALAAEARTGNLHKPPPGILTLLLLGASGGGKSELLNALAGAAIADSHHRRPTTTRPLVYLHESLSPARLYEYGNTLGDLATELGTLKTHQVESLRNKIIIDAPDIDSYRTEHREQVLHLLKAVDLALYVVTPLSYKDDIGWSTVLQERGRRGFAFVINKWDRDATALAADQIPELEADFTKLIEDRAGYRSPKVFHVSARNAVLESQNQPTPDLLPGENLPALKEWISNGLSSSRIEQIQRRRRRAQWGELAAAVAAATPQAPDSPAVSKILDADLAQIQHELETLAHIPVSQHAASLARLNETETQITSPGPFGFFLNGFYSLTNRWRRNRLPAVPAVDVTDRLWSDIENTFATRLAELQWHLRQTGLELDSLDEQWGGLPETQGKIWQREFAAASATAAQARTHWARKFFTMLILVAGELAVTGLIGVALYRLGYGFYHGDYTGAQFVVHFLALLAAIITLGAVIITGLNPPRDRAIQSTLLGLLHAGWKNQMDQINDQIINLAQTQERLSGQGNKLKQSCGNQAEDLTREMQKIDDPETERLYAAAK